MTHASTKSAIVTGASRGIGRAVALRLARDGFAVVVNYAGHVAKAEEAVAVRADVASAADVERLFEQTLDTYGRVDVVVNSAGIMPLLPIAGGDLAVFDQVIATNLRGAFVVMGTGSSATYARRPLRRGAAQCPGAQGESSSAAGACRRQPVDTARLFEPF